MCITIVAGLCDIANALPAVELATVLYPTTLMKHAVATLYAHIIKFLVQAFSWYEESKIARAIHSITKPAALRYDDTIKAIQSAARNISEQATASSRAEQRVMHHEIRAMRAEVQDGMSRESDDLTNLRLEIHMLKDVINGLKANAVASHTFKESARIQIRHDVSNAQLEEALSVITSSSSLIPEIGLQAATVRRNRHQSIKAVRCAPFWLSPEMQTWNAQPASSSMLLKAAFRDRLQIQDFCTSVIQQLKSNHIATFWVLKSKGQTCSVMEVLKSLVLQALSLDRTMRSDIALSFQLQKLRGIMVAEDWVNLLGELLEHFSLAYIIIEAEAMPPLDAIQLQSDLRELDQGLSARGAKTRIKLLYVIYGVNSVLSQAQDELMLQVRRTATRKGQCVPADPLATVNRSSLPIASPRAPGSRPSSSYRRRGVWQQKIR